MARSRLRSKGRASSGSFLALPHVVIESKLFLKLSVHGVKLLIDLASQYRGSNNGDFSAAWSLMEKRGWKSRDTLSKALHQLLDFGFIERTRVGGNPRQGGARICALYAVTWHRIDECKGKCMPTRTPSNLWRKKELTLHACQDDTSTVSENGK